MNRQRIVILAAAALMVGACGSDGDQPGTVVQETELRLSSSLSLQTRAAYAGTQDTQIAAGETVYAWVDEAKATGADEYVQAWQLTADGSGGLSGAKKHYPVSGNPIDVYALHGSFAAAPSGSFPASALSHSVATDQTSLAGYAGSDLLFAKGTGLARQTAAHSLQFSHLLSKVEVYLVAGTGTTDAELESAQVTVLGTRTGASVTFSKTAAPVVAASGAAAPITARMQTEADQTVTISGTAQPAHRFAEAVVVPQEVSGDLIQVTVGASSFTAQAAKTFTGGNRYVYNVVVNKSGIELTSTIVPWGDGGTEVISAK